MKNDSLNCAEYIPVSHEASSQIKYQPTHHPLVFHVENFQPHLKLPGKSWHFPVTLGRLGRCPKFSVVEVEAPYYEGKRQFNPKCFGMKRRSFESLQQTYLHVCLCWAHCSLG